MNPVKQTEALDTPGVTPTCVRCDQTRALLCAECSRASAAGLMADYSAVARQSLDAAERAQLAYSTVLDAYRTEEAWAEQWLKEALTSRVVIRDLRGDNAMLRAQVTELLGQLDKATGRSTYTDPLRLAERRSAYRVEATS